MDELKEKMTNFKEQVRQAADLLTIVSETVSLKRRGTQYWGCCPFHGEKTPSFKVDPARGLFHCFGCGAGGDVFSYVMKRDNLTFPEALKQLAEKYGIPVPERAKSAREIAREKESREVMGANDLASRFFHSCLVNTRYGERGIQYLAGRGIGRDIIDSFGLGLAPPDFQTLSTALEKRGVTEEVLLKAGLVSPRQRGTGVYDKFRARVMIPIRDPRGRVVGFTGRILDKDASPAKYMNTPETAWFHKGNLLFGLDRASGPIRKRQQALIVEGHMDAISLHAAGIDWAVASMGTALTVEQTRLLSRFTKELVLCYDNDNAGKIATERALQILNNSEFSVKVLQLPRRLVDGEYVKQDADDFIKFQGPDAFERLLSGSENGVEFRMAQVAGKYDLSSDEARVAYCEEISDLLASLPSAVEREIYTTRAAEAAKITPDAMKLEVQRAFKRRTARENRAELRKELNPAAQLQPKERSLRYENMRSARAEQGVLRLLLMDESLFPDDPPLKSEQFSSPLLGRVFGLLWDAKAEGRTVSLASLSNVLSQEEMNHITAVCQQPESVQNGRQALADYIRIIKTEADKRAGAVTDPLLAATEKYKDKKGTGGKQYG